MFKRRFALWAALLDLSGIWSVEQTFEALSQAACVALNGAVRFLLSRAHENGAYFPTQPETPEAESGYIVLGLGKLGASELNYSSDIDIIVFFDPLRANLREGLSHQEFFVGVTKDLVKLMQERTAGGYVFRTDLRLRPDPGATQVALSREAGLIYYESFGQNWERAAMIKARPVAGDVEAGAAFLEELSPFIWRKYLDFAAIADVHAMKRQIHAVKGHGRIAVRGHNIKLGRGGIREIEFFVQTQQLIAGGRQPELRLRRTLDALAQLVGEKWIEQQTADDLKEAYLFLRHVEHRLQMIADEQTHRLPVDDNDLLRIARFAGFEDYEAFAETLRGYLETVQAHYGALFEDVPELSSDSGNLVFTGDEHDPGTIKTLEAFGFQSPSQVIETVKNWHFGRYPATRSERARERLTELQPVLLSALADTAQPDAALIAFDRFLEDLPGGVQLFSLLRNNPKLLSLISDIMGTAPRLALVLSRRANLLDAVLDPGFFGDLPSDEVLKGLVDESIGACRDYQDCLDLARDIAQEQTFLIGARVLSGTVSPSQAGAAFSHLAQHIICSLYEKVEREMRSVHGEVAGGSAAVIAMGKLGGEEMTALSDLDLILVYDFDPSQSQSSGPKPLSISQYYSRFTQRLISALTAPTAAGKLYEVDLRLRPSGNSGPVATSYESFVDYHQNKAWTWEHMALTRARVVCGPDPLKSRIEGLIQEVLLTKRDESKIRDDVLDMRARISETKASDSLWDLKHAQGGLVDLEFLVQYLQLVHASDVPECLSRSTLKAYQNCRDAGLIEGEEAEQLISAVRLYNDLSQVLRLCYEGNFVPEEAPQGLQALLAEIAGEPSLVAVEGQLKEMQSFVGEAFHRHLSDG